MNAVKFMISRPLTADKSPVSWGDVWNDLRDIQFASAKALNHCMTQWYMWQKEREDFKQEHGRYPAFKLRLYHELRSLFPSLHSHLCSEIERKAELRWKTDTKTCFYSMEKSLPTFKKNFPILLRGGGRSYYVKKDDRGYVLSCGLRPKDYDGFKRFEFLLCTKKVSGSQMSILKKLVSGEYPFKSALIAFNQNKNKWALVLAYRPEKKNLCLSGDVIVGVDFGIAMAFYCAISGSKQSIFQLGGEIDRFRKFVAQKRKQLSNQGRFSRCAKGHVKKLSPVFKLSGKEKRFKDTVNHRYSKAIIDFAVKNGAGVIQIENLDSLKKKKIMCGKDERDFFLKDWPVGDLQEKLKYKAAGYGIQIVEVNPKHTSQRCSECGYIDAGNRKTQSLFECGVCGFRGNADMNAARNLAIRDIDGIIDDYLKNWQAV